LPLLALDISHGHITRQLIWFFAGLFIIIIFSYTAFHVLWKNLKLEAIKSTKLSLITALLLIFIWFTILFNIFISLHLIIIVGIIIAALLFIMISKLDEN
jgi:hypothetical protein